MDKDINSVIDEKLNSIGDSIEDLYVPLKQEITDKVNEQNKIIENDRRYELINELIKLNNLGISINREDINNSMFENMSIEELESKIIELKNRD